jgi:hypothetical protein
VQGVHEQQLLVLLLVGQAQLEERLGLGVERSLQQCLHVPVDVVAVGKHLVKGRPGHQPALRTRLARANGLVVGVEQITEGAIEHCITCQVGL